MPNLHTLYQIGTTAAYFTAAMPFIMALGYILPVFAPIMATWRVRTWVYLAMAMGLLMGGGYLYYATRPVPPTTITVQTLVEVDDYDGEDEPELVEVVEETPVKARITLAALHTLPAALARGCVKLAGLALAKPMELLCHLLPKTWSDAAVIGVIYLVHRWGWFNRYVYRYRSDEGMLEQEQEQPDEESGPRPADEEQRKEEEKPKDEQDKMDNIIMYDHTTLHLMQRRRTVIDEIVRRDKAAQAEREERVRRSREARQAINAHTSSVREALAAANTLSRQAYRAARAQLAGDDRERVQEARARVAAAREERTARHAELVANNAEARQARRARTRNEYLRFRQSIRVNQQRHIQRVQGWTLPVEEEVEEEEPAIAEDEGDNPADLGEEQGEEQDEQGGEGQSINQVGSHEQTTPPSSLQGMLSGIAGNALRRTAEEGAEEVVEETVNTMARQASNVVAPETVAAAMNRVAATFGWLWDATPNPEDLRLLVDQGGEEGLRVARRSFSRAISEAADQALHLGPFGSGEGFKVDEFKRKFAGLVTKYGYKAANKLTKDMSGVYSQRVHSLVQEVMDEAAEEYAEEMSKKAAAKAVEEATKEGVEEVIEQGVTQRLGEVLGPYVGPLVGPLSSCGVGLAIDAGVTGIKATKHRYWDKDGGEMSFAEHYKKDYGPVTRKLATQGSSTAVSLVATAAAPAAVAALSTFVAVPAAAVTLVPIGAAMGGSWAAGKVYDYAYSKEQNILEQGAASARQEAERVKRSFEETGLQEQIIQGGREGLEALRNSMQAASPSVARID